MKHERNNAFTEKAYKVALVLNYDKRMQSIDSIEIYEIGMSKDLVIEKKTVKVIQSGCKFLIIPTYY